jgi:hypothetical protein
MAVDQVNSKNLVGIVTDENLRPARLSSKGTSRAGLTLSTNLGIATHILLAPCLFGSLIFHKTALRSHLVTHVCLFDSATEFRELAAPL